MRARNIKPGLFKNELLGRADPLLTILFEGLWCAADREGRLEDRPLRLSAEVFPYRRNLTEKKIDGMLSWLQRNNFIVRYSIDDVPYIQVCKFSEHQNPHKNESPSKIQQLNSLLHSASTVQAPEYSGTSTVLEQPLDEGLGLIPDSLIPDSLIPPFNPPSQNKPQTTDAGATHLNGQAVRSNDKIKLADIKVVFDHWRSTWNHPDAVLDKKRIARINARLTEKFTPTQLCNAISGFKRSPWHTGTDPKSDGRIYDKLDTLLRDAAQVETGIALLAKPEPQKWT